MTNISFKPRSATVLDTSYFTNLEEVSRELVSTLRLNRDEADFLDKKLPPDLIALSANVLEALKQRDERAEAEHFLQTELIEQYPIADIIIAILRQNFRIDDERIARWLENYLADLVTRDDSGTARKAVIEAAGSEIHSLAQLADEVSLKIADISDLVRLAEDPYCSISVRIKAARKLAAAQDIRGVEAALRLIDAQHHNPNLKQPLLELVKTFGTFRELNPRDLEDSIVDPVLTMLKNNEQAHTQRRMLLERIIDQLPNAFLRTLQEINVMRLDYNNWFYAPVALGRCAQHEAMAVELLFEWAETDSAPDGLRAECCVRLANERTVRTPNFEPQLLSLRETLSRELTKEKARNKAVEALDKALSDRRGKSETMTIGEAYSAVYQSWEDENTIDPQLAWYVLNQRNSPAFMQQRIMQADDTEKDFLTDLITSDRVNRLQPARLATITRVLLESVNHKPNHLYATLFTAASKLADNDPVRHETIQFLVERIKAKHADAAIAQQCWQQSAHR